MTGIYIISWINNEYFYVGQTQSFTKLQIEPFSSVYQNMYQNRTIPRKTWGKARTNSGTWLLVNCIPDEKEEERARKRENHKPILRGLIFLSFIILCTDLTIPRKNRENRRNFAHPGLQNPFSKTILKIISKKPFNNLSRTCQQPHNQKTPESPPRLQKISLCPRSMIFLDSLRGFSICP